MVSLLCLSYLVCLDLLVLASALPARSMAYLSSRYKGRVYVSNYDFTKNLCQTRPSSILPILLSTVTSPLVGAGGDQFDRAATKCFSQLITLFAATPHTLPVALIPSPSLLAFIANTIVSTGVCRLAIGVPLRSLLLLPYPLHRYL
jgi:hypothetical protein